MEKKVSKRSENAFLNRTNGPSLQGSGSLESMVTCKTRSVFFQDEQNQSGGCSVHVEVSVEAENKFQRACEMYAFVA